MSASLHNVDDAMNDHMNDVWAEPEHEAHKETYPEENTSVDPEPLGPREPQAYRIVPQSPTPSNPEAEIRWSVFENRQQDYSVNDHVLQEQNNYDEDTRTLSEANSCQDKNDDQNGQHPASENEDSHKRTRNLEVSSTTRLLLHLAGSAIIGTLGWKFLRSQLARDLLKEAIATSAALKVVGRGLLGIGAAATRGVWAVVKHCGRHPRKYGALGMLYSLWNWGTEIAGWLLEMVLALGDAIPFPTETCYCYACRVRMAMDIERETGVRVAEVQPAEGTSAGGGNRGE